MLRPVGRVAADGAEHGHHHIAAHRVVQHIGLLAALHGMAHVGRGVNGLCQAPRIEQANGPHQASHQYANHAQEKYLLTKFHECALLNWRPGVLAGDDWELD